MAGNFNGFYNNTLDAYINTNAGNTDLIWRLKNKLNTEGFDYDTMYHTGNLFASSQFPTYILNAYLNKVKTGIAWSGTSEVDKAIAFNKAQTDSRKKLSHLVSELEDYGSGNVTPAQFKSLLETNYPKAKAAGLRFGVYNGWTKQWDVVVKNSDFLLLHCYISSTNMASASALYNYVSGRLALVANEAAKLGKIYPVSIIFSCEPSFGQTYFKTNAWTKPFDMLMTEYNKKASSTMKANLIMDGSYIFVTKYAKVSKP